MNSSNKYDKLFVCLLTAVILTGNEVSAMFGPIFGAEKHSVGFPVLHLTNDTVDTVSDESSVAESLPDDCWRHISLFLPFEDIRNLADVRSSVREWMKDLFGSRFWRLDEEAWRYLSNFVSPQNEMYDGIPEGLIIPIPYLLCGAASNGIESVWDAISRIRHFGMPGDSFWGLLMGEGMQKGEGFWVLTGRMFSWIFLVAHVDLTLSFAKRSGYGTEMLDWLRKYKCELLEGLKAFYESLPDASDVSVSEAMGELSVRGNNLLGGVLMVVCLSDLFLNKDKDVEEVMMNMPQSMFVQWYAYFGLYEDVKKILRTVSAPSYKYLVDLALSLSKTSDNGEVVRFVVEEMPVDGTTLRDEIFKTSTDVTNVRGFIEEKVRLLHVLSACIRDERPEISCYLLNTFGDIRIASEDAVRCCFLFGWYKDAKEFLVRKKTLSCLHLVRLVASVCKMSDDVDAAQLLIEEVPWDERTLREVISNIGNKEACVGKRSYDYVCNCERCALRQKIAYEEAQRVREEARRRSDSRGTILLDALWSSATEEGTERPNIVRYLWDLFGDKLEATELVSEECKRKFRLPEPQRSRCSVM